MKVFLIGLLLIFSFARCAEVNSVTSIVSEDANKQAWENQLESMREKYNAYIGKSTSVLLLELGEPTNVRENVFKSGKKYDSEWSYVFSKGVTLLTDSQKVVRFYIIDDIVQTLRVF